MQSVLAANQVGKSSGYRVMPTSLIPSKGNSFDLSIYGTARRPEADYAESPA